MRILVAKMHPLIFQVTFLGLVTVTALNADWAEACPAGCQSYVELQRRHKDRIAKLQDVKAKNVAFLKGLSAGSASARVKVTSNIMMCDIGLETAQNEIESNKRSAKAKGCQECLI